MISHEALIETVKLAIDAALAEEHKAILNIVNDVWLMEPCPNEDCESAWKAACETIRDKIRALAKP